MLDLNALECDFAPQSLIGEGGFSQVFVAVYKGTKVAVKRLMVHEVDLIKMSSREKARQIRRIQAEANVMSQCSIHHNITVRRTKTKSRDVLS